MKIRPIFKTIDIFSFIQFLSRQTNYIIKFFLLKVLYLVYHSFMMFKNGVKSLSCGVALSTLLLMAMNRTPFFGKRISLL